MADDGRINDQEDSSQTEQSYDPSGELIGQDGPISQGDVRFSDVPEDMSPGDEFVMIDENTGELIDLSDIEDMENYASITRNGLNILVDSDVEEITGQNDDADEYLVDFTERQNVASGTRRLIEKMSDYNGQSAETSANDVDAAWENNDQGGEESVGGTASTPGQDVVDEIGQAVGISYSDDEPLNTEEKLEARDENRWELNPASTDDDQQ